MKDKKAILTSAHTPRLDKYEISKDVENDQNMLMSYDKIPQIHIIFEEVTELPVDFFTKSIKNRYIMKTKDEFIKFLKSHRMYSAFVRNLTYTSIDRHIDAVTNETTPQLFIGSAFSWRSSPEGLDRWETLDEKWRKACNQYSE